MRIATRGSHISLLQSAALNSIAIDASRIHAARLTGTERYARHLIAALLAQAPDQRFTLYLRQPLDAQDAAFQQPNAAVRVIEQRRLWTHRGLADALQQDRPSILFVPAHVLPFAARSAAFKRRTRTVLTVHDCGFRHFPEAHPLRQRLYLDWSTRFAIRHASVVLTDSEATRRDLIELYRADPARLRVAYPGVTWVQPVGSAERDAVLKRFALTDRRYVLHVGTLQPRKNLRRLIDAFAALTARPGFADCALVLAGGRGWGGEDLNAYARMRGVHHSVRLTGYVDDATRAALLAGAHVYACPSLYEGFGFPVLEAQTHGIAVACSATSSLGEVVGAGAITFDPLDTGAISVALETLLTDADARARAIDAGRKNVQRFSWQSCARMTLAACVDT